MEEGVSESDFVLCPYVELLKFNELHETRVSDVYTKIEKYKLFLKNVLNLLPYQIDMVIMLIYKYMDDPTLNFLPEELYIICPRRYTNTRHSSQNHIDGKFLSTPLGRCDGDESIDKNLEYCNIVIDDINSPNKKKKIRKLRVWRKVNFIKNRKNNYDRYGKRNDTSIDMGNGQ